MLFDFSAVASTNSHTYSRNANICHVLRGRRLYFMRQSNATQWLELCVSAVHVVDTVVDAAVDTAVDVAVDAAVDAAVAWQRALKSRSSHTPLNFKWSRNAFSHGSKGAGDCDYDWLWLGPRLGDCHAPCPYHQPPCPPRVRVYVYKNAWQVWSSTKRKTAQSPRPTF